MINNASLKSIFAQSKEQLLDELKGLVLPKDAQQVQKIVADHLGQLFESGNDFRQSLTASEDYILQSALQLLQAQQNITVEIAKSVKNVQSTPRDASAAPKKHPNPYSTLVGTGVGALAGGILGTWGAVAGAIAGTAIVIYCASKPQMSDNIHQQGQRNTPSCMDAEIFVRIVEQICECIDGVIDTYRVQVKRIQNIYEQREKPSLLNECSVLFAQIANVHKAVEANKGNTPAKVVSATEMLVESLENYGLTIKDGKVVNE